MHINKMEGNAEPEFSIELIISSISMMALVSILAVCICCKRRSQKSELAGIEGIVKLKHLDDSTVNISIDTTDSSDPLSPKLRLAQKNATLPFDAKLGNGNGFQDNELKRSSSNAPHRSLPDIPIVETAVCDNNSELYATVGDKVQEKAPSKSPLNPKKLANISQNSSMSQADDSSPYARVRSPQHAYDKLKKTEHPYAQVIQPTTGGIATVVLENDDDDDDDEDETTIENPISHRESSNNDLLSTAESHLDASAAISGRISASQELPYMTPPIVTSMTTAHNHPQHFSGDSQDSSKGYTSISVREPLANIIAQTNQQNAQRRRREIQDSHNNFYATVSDDSDEMYAAIEDPNNPSGVDLYTSGSETYAQIQAPMTVSVEINPPPPTQQQTTSQTTQSVETNHRSSTVRPNSHHEDISQIDVLKSLHSRQASSSSCTSSVGNNIGSPKPEKRQANSPLPPTPQNKTKDSNNNSNKTRQDVEGMYAKVMKKNKLSSVPFENSSPVLNRNEADVTDSTVTEIKVLSGNEYETIDKKRHRNNKNNETSNYSGYETIPADRNNNNNDGNESLILASSNPHYAQIKEKTEEIFQDENIPKYETLKLSNRQQQPQQQPQQKGMDSITTDSDYDPNYEIVVNKKQQRISSSSSTSSTLVDDGYSQIGKKLKLQQKDFSDDDESIPGYSTIKKPENDYSSIGEEQRKLRNSLKMSDTENDTDSNLYSSIPAVVQVQSVISPSTDSNSSDMHLDYEQITSASITPTTVNNNYELLSLSESSITEPSMRYVKENPYERLHNEKSPDVESMSSGKGQPQQQNSGSAVDDFFKV